MVPFKILDGSMGSELINRGLILPEHIWSADANITSPDMVEKIHSEYVAAGADYITANTFRTTTRAYKKTVGRRGAGYRNHDAALAARTSLHKGVELAKNVASNYVKVAGSIAPLEDCYSPDLFPCVDVAIAEFNQLGEWLTKAGVDILLLETMNSIVETEAALIGTRNLGLPVWVSFVLKDSRHLLSGDSLTDAFNRIKDYAIDTVLLNCNTLDLTLVATEILVTDCPHKWGVYPNLGIGDPSPDGHILNCEKMDRFLSTMKKIIALGPSVMGGCCGSSPHHISKLFELKRQADLFSKV